MAETGKKQPFKSLLEEHAPEHLKAIGLIAVEATLLETSLGTLLAAVIDAPEYFGQIVYLTPKSAIARLDTLENVVEWLLVKDSTGAKKLEGVAKRTRAILGKRHKVVHGCWGITNGKVSVYSLPQKEDDKPEPYTVEQLMRIVSDIRDLVAEMVEIIRELRTYHRAVRESGTPRGW